MVALYCCICFPLVFHIHIDVVMKIISCKCSIHIFVFAVFVFVFIVSTPVKRSSLYGLPEWLESFSPGTIFFAICLIRSNKCSGILSNLKLCRSCCKIRLVMRLKNLTPPWKLPAGPNAMEPTISLFIVFPFKTLSGVKNWDMTWHQIDAYLLLSNICSASWISSRVIWQSFLILVTAK